MSKAYVDPADLRRFSSELNRFNTEIGTLLGGLKSRLAALEATWRDQEQRKFTESFVDTMKVVSKFLDDSHAHVGTLNKKAAIIEEYLKQR
jgi:uncharacterized protein YukE